MRILVVDDERAFVVLLARMLSRLGHDAVVAMDGHEALEAIKDEPVTAVITDIDMPGMDGVQLAREILSVHAGTPIVFCTGSDPAGDVARDAAAIGPVMPKAISMASVREVLDALHPAS